ncbi:MAG TPA: energy-coupled thiamine transporter ThiT [Bacilli bacterium]|nr:energy-coupled thiamine transporter ThiT [Bacilli bacterium]
MKNKQLLIIIEIAMMSSIGIILDYLSTITLGFAWPNGGSIGVAMVVVFVIAFRRGVGAGLLTGFLIGLLQLLYAGGGFLHLIQAFFDYYGAYAAVGLAGIVSKRLTTTKALTTGLYMSVAMLIAGFIRFILHVLSGMWYWGAGLVASLAYNIGYMAPSIVLSIIVVIVIWRMQPKIIFPDKE